MEFIDLKTQYRRLEPLIRQRIDAVLERGSYIMGPEVGELEEKLAGFAKAKHCISCASGTDALLMPLMAWGIGPGDAVFAPAFSFFATAEVVALLGATPVLVDINPDTFNIDPDKLAAAVEAVKKGDPKLHPLPVQAMGGALKPKAVITADLFGQPADYAPILDMAAKQRLAVLEDAAQGFGGVYRGQRACGLGCHAAATSFFPAKPLGCYGDGGAIFTDDDELADLCRSIRVHGKGSHKYDNARIGLNGRLDTLQAAILLPKLDILGEEIEARQLVAKRYAEGLAGSAVATPKVPDGFVSAWAQYTVRLKNRDAVAAALGKAGIPTGVYYPKTLAAQSALAYLGYGADAFPEAEQAALEVLSLPMHPYLNEKEQRRIIDSLLHEAKPQA